MKKIILLVFVALVTISCGSDDELVFNSPEDNPILPKQVTVIEDGSVTATTTFTYNGNKLHKVTESYEGNLSETNEKVYTYTGDLITRIDYNFSDNNDNGYALHFYSSDKIIRTEYYYSNVLSHSDHYVYYSDGSMSLELRDENGNIFETINTRLSFNNAGEVVKAVEYHTDGTYTTIHYIYHHTNDSSKNSTFVNMVGLKEAFSAYSDVFTITKTITIYEGSESIESIEGSYTYNSYGFLVSAIKGSVEQTYTYYNE